MLYCSMKENDHDKLPWLFFYLLGYNCICVYFCIIKSIMISSIRIMFVNSKNDNMFDVLVYGKNDI